MDQQIRTRKLEHIQCILDDKHVERRADAFDKIELLHRALPEINYEQVDPSCSFLGRDLSMPLMISSMTGGDHPRLVQINENLAIAAQSCRVALAVGSQRIALEREQACQSFDLRRLAPDVPLLANLGAVQLNYGYGLQECLRCIDMLQADALILHLNPLQEAIQPEGNTRFEGLLKKIEALIRQLPVPLVVKEVGCGFSANDLYSLSQCGVQWVDVAGKGGTSWSRIEGQRGGDSLGISFQDWGIATPDVLKLAARVAPGLKLIASGGMRNAQDMAKAHVLGATLCGMAKPFLEPAMQDSGSVVSMIESLKRELKVAMFLLGQRQVQSLIGNDTLIFNSEIR